MHPQQTPPNRSQRHRECNSGGNSANTSNYLHTANSFGDCQSPISEARSPVEAPSRVQKLCLSEESLKNAIIEFDSQIFFSSWKLLKQSEATASLNQQKHLELPSPSSEINKKFTHEALQLTVAIKATVEFPRHDCVLLSIDGKSIAVNRELLKSASQLLRMEFSFDDSDPYIQLPLRFEALTPVVEAIYYHESGNQEGITTLLKSLELPLLFEVFEAAVRLNIPVLINMLGNYLYELATPSIYVVTYHQLKIFCAPLAEKLWEKIVGEFYKVCLLRTHKLLTASEIRRALFNERINVSRGDEIGILRSWARSNRLESQPAEFQTMRRQLTDHMLGSLGRNRQQRLPYSVIFALGGWGSGGPTERLEVMSGYTENWIEPRMPLGELPSPRCYYAAIPMSEMQQVIILGGFNGVNYYEGSTRFNLETLSWDESSYAPMHERRCYVNAARIDSTHIIACGGYNNRERLTSAEILDVNRNVWTEVASMNVIRSDAHAVELDGRIYCVGGFDGHSCHRTVEVYDPVLNQWSMLDREMRDKRSGVSAISINGVILGIGGFSGRHRLSTAEFYDPREGIWHPISCLILSRSNFGISELRSDPVVFGGYDGSGTTEMCERFDWRADKWVSLPSLRFRRSALSVFRVDNLPNVERLFIN